MKRILATTALVMIMAAGAHAQMGSYNAQPGDIEASDFIGARIYATNTMPADTAAAGAEKDWDDVGEINDVVLGRDGQIKAVILGVGGFLGIGEKSVAVPMQDVKFVKNGDAPDDYFLVVNTNKDALTSAPAYVSIEEKAQQQAAARDAADPVGAVPAPADDVAMNNDATPAMPADDNAAAMDNNDAAVTDQTTTSSTTTDNAAQAMTDENRTRLVRPDVAMDGYQAAQVSELTADRLQGARVYGPNNEEVGEVSKLILDNNGQVERIVLDIGGFLGIGERQIAVTPDELNIVRTADGNDFRVYVDSNQATLKAQPEYKG
ncbi:MAG: PRC-barrel domain-containing protein [Rhizobiaceae bacterium]|nr:PRC-barrel domain-containing protein [Rhizobiaceae bacterium]